MFAIKFANKLLKILRYSSENRAKYLIPLFSKKIEVSRTPIYLKATDDEDLKSIYHLVPNALYGSCVCDNEITEGYDLQIIVPVYKVEQYIEDCMDSIVNQQTKYKFLVVVINDGSPDGSREKLRRYEGLDNVVIIDQENRGFSGARNTGLKHIKAKYVTFVDSDDRMMPGAIEAMMKEAMNQDADIVEGSYKTFYNGDEHEGSRHDYAVTDQWIGKLFGYPWGKVIRSTKFEHICFPEGYWFEDTLFSFILYNMCKKMVTIPDDVYLYRINPKGISSTSVGNPKVIDSLLVTLQLLEDAKTLGLPMTAQCYDMFLRQVRMNYSRISTLHNTSIDRHVFAATCRAKRQYFPTEHTTNSHLRPIEQALNEHDVGKYRVLCSIR
jgi:glycosyltransferase involved in cell wall biosynthesis